MNIIFLYGKKKKHANIDFNYAVGARVVIQRNEYSENLQDSSKQMEVVRENVRGSREKLGNRLPHGALL